MNRAEVESGVEEILTTVLECPQGSRLDRANQPAWDSLKHMQIVFAVEEKFGVQFGEEQIQQLDSLAKIADGVVRLNAS